jgi:hypothetical protein
MKDQHEGTSREERQWQGGVNISALSGIVDFLTRAAASEVFENYLGFHL